MLQVCGKKMIESISAFDTQKSAQNECDQAQWQKNIYRFFTLIDLFQNSSKVNNLFGLLLKAIFLPSTLKIAQSGHTALNRCIRRPRQKGEDQVI